MPETLKTSRSTSLLRSKVQSNLVIVSSLLTLNTDFGVNKTINLIPDGSNIAVTKENRLQYIYLVSHYRLSKQIKLQSEAFFEGLSQIIDHKWLKCVTVQVSSVPLAHKTW